MVPANLFAGDSGNSLKVGGAIRYNIIHTNYESDPTPLSTAFTWDTWRLNVDGSAAGIDLSFEYRFYPTFGTHFIQHGYLGYAFSDKLYGKLGVFQKPFGITKYASHSWWFQGGYYVGLEDDYDMGIGFFYEATPSMHINLAYYRQAEPEGPSYNGVVTFGNAGPGRYSYDVVPSPGNNASLREMNTVNAQVTYDLSKALQVGISGQFGQLYNSVLDDASMASAYAAHLVANFGPLNLKTEFINYDYTAQGDDGTDLDIVYMGAYGFPYPVAARANLYVAGLAYSIPVKMGPISNIQAYVDYTLTDKANSNYEDTALLIPGFLVSAGKVYTYVDYAMGVNQPWLTDTFGIGLGQGVANAKWNKRFNVNIGYYF
ncbi:MAG: hypothetical protein K9N34_05155 [Candidatus Marinimicrobia bacterium]|nr:hypothetical protein [Candidatus Neomarinimicrobiota bacterium]